MNIDRRMRVCPWCRNEMAERGVCSEQSKFWAGHFHWFGNCECGARGPQADSEEEARREWNGYPIWKMCTALELLKLEVVMNKHNREAFEILDELRKRARENVEIG